jgi:DNA-binding transcriptional regulator YiaG
MGTLLAEVQAEQALPAPDACREIRRGAGVSQARLAAELEVAELTVARWEAGTRHPRGEMRRRYAALLDGLDQAARGAGEGGTAA